MIISELLMTFHIIYTIKNYTNYQGIHHMNKKIPFTLPDITEDEINEVVDTLRSGWITTGKKTKDFEKKISDYCGAEKTICLNSATAGLELILRLFDIGEGDEVITTPYTFAASANVILHTGAKPVFVDIKKDQFNIDPAQIAKAITEKTKAVIPVDIAGYPVDYDEIIDVLNTHRNKFIQKKNTLQEHLDRPILLADCAHSFGAKYKNRMIGSIGDFNVFSFHAVKNLTTAEGGAISFNSLNTLTAEDIYKKLMLLSLHGQSKDAFSKLKAGAWQYSIDIAGYKYNMPDITASIGLAQLRRYDRIMEKRKKICDIYATELSKDDRFIIPDFISKDKCSCYHLFLLRVKNIDEKERNTIIQKCAEIGISLNVHFIPLVMQPLYKNLGYDIAHFPNTYNTFKNVISLPLSSVMQEEDAYYICEKLRTI